VRETEERDVTDMSCGCLRYGENMHVEVIKRSAQIPRFLGLQRMV
jgi:hypothetical protein